MRRHTTTMLIVHCTATRPDQDVGADWIDRLHKGPRFDKRREKWRFQGRWHEERPDTSLPDGNGWSGIGYHRVIRLDGTREAGRPIMNVGAHCRGHNRQSVAVAVAGGVDEDGKPAFTFNERQLMALDMEIVDLRNQFPTIEVVCGHRDLSPDVNNDGVIDDRDWLKACPSMDVPYWLETGVAVFQRPDME